MTLRTATILLAVALAFAAATPARAQRDSSSTPLATSRSAETGSGTTPAATPSTETPAAAPAPAAALLTADENGFQFKAADNSFNLRLRGEMHSDGRFFVDDAAATGASTFYVRRARLAFQGTLASSFDFLVRADFGQARAELTDAYLDARLLPGLNLQGGKFKEPVGLERLQSASDRTMIETGFPTALVPNRDVGLAVYGALFDRRLTYQAGVFNGVPDGGSGDTDAYDGKDVAGRLFAQPFRTARAKALKGLGFGLAASTGTQHGDPAATSLPSFRTSARQTFFRYRAGADLAATALAAGRRTRLTPQAHYYYGPFGLTTEYVRNVTRVERGADAADLVTEAAHVTAGLFLTGENATFGRLRPKRPFDSSTGQWGAVEVAGRVQTLRVDEAAFPVFADPARSARSAFAWAVGVNWYLTSNVRFAVNYERTTFEAAAGGARLAAESLLLSRIFLSF